MQNVLNTLFTIVKYELPPFPVTASTLGESEFSQVHTMARLAKFCPQIIFSFFLLPMHYTIGYCNVSFGRQVALVVCTGGEKIIMCKTSLACNLSSPLNTVYIF